MLTDHPPTSQTILYKKNYMWHLTCDTWYLTPDMRHVVRSEHSLKISALLLYHWISKFFFMFQAVSLNFPRYQIMMLKFYTTLWPLNHGEHSDWLLCSQVDGVFQLLSNKLYNVSWWIESKIIINNLNQEDFFFI